MGEGILAESDRRRRPAGRRWPQAAITRWGSRELKWLLVVGAVLVVPWVGPRILSLASFNRGEVARVKAGLGLTVGVHERMPRAYQMAIAADPGNYLPYLGYGHWLLDRGDPPAAVPWLEQAVALNPSSRVAHFFLGIASLEQGQMERATAQFRQSDVRAGYLMSRAWQEVLQTREQAGPDRDWTPAERYYQAAVALQPESFALWSYLANFYVYSPRDYERALTTLRAAAEALPASPEPHQRAARLLWDQWRDARGAVAELEAAVRLDPGDIGSYLLAADILLKERDVSGAEGWLRRALSVAPRNPEVHFRLGDLYLDQERAPQAIRELQAATAGAPGEASYQARLAEALQTMGLQADAIQAAERAAAL
ncbi:MAG TPA: hypothetical protein DEP84_23355, partial [Chloroflexi bacterium]|nr:hypothetical protein [Chloroflexota bacterium]